MLTIVSGGQTGVDRAALDAAIANSIDYGGWCPRGGRAEDMRRAPGVLVRYPKLHETPLADPAQRTEWNVRRSRRSAPGRCLVQRMRAGRSQALHRRTARK
jgi:hypothetical protein